MPLLLSHLHFATQQLSGLKIGNYQRAGFLVGSILPDIRYISGDSREKTHLLLKDEKEISNRIRSIKKKNLTAIDLAIETGVIFHSFLDVWWRRQVFLASPSKFIGLALQIVDEEQAFVLIDRKIILKRVNEIQISTFMSIPEPVVKKWLLLVSDYLSYDRFEVKRVVNLISAGKNYDSGVVDEILQLVDFVKNNKSVVDQMSELKKQGIPKEFKNLMNDLWLN